jgi:hypothetical protein
MFIFFNRKYDIAEPFMAQHKDVYAYELLYREMNGSGGGTN